MNRIILNLGNFKLDEIQLEKGSLSIGRASDNDITLEDPATSSHHAKLVTIFTSSFIEDLNSTNGTLVNGRKVIRHTLHHGDIVSIGNLQLLFKSDDMAEVKDNNRTMTMDKEKLKSLVSAVPNSTGVTVRKSESKAGSDKNGAIPVLDKSLPLSELRKISSKAAVIKLDTKNKSKQKPVDSASPHVFGFEDTVISPDTEPDTVYKESFDEDAVLSSLSGQMDNTASTVLAKIAIAVSILAVIIFSIYLLF